MQTGQLALDGAQLRQGRAGFLEQAASANRRALLGQIAKADFPATLDPPGVRFELAHHQPEQGCFAGAVGTDQPDPVTPVELPVELVEEFLAAKGQRQVGQL